MVSTGMTGGTHGCFYDSRVYFLVTTSMLWLEGFDSSYLFWEKNVNAGGGCGILVHVIESKL